MAEDPNKTLFRRNPSIGFALIAADGFRQSARQFIEWASSLDTSEWARQGGARMGDCIACATSLTFSIELYLKALWMLADQRPPRDHDLWALYDGLPEDAKTSIEKAYGKVTARPNSKLSTVWMHFTPLEPIPPPKVTRPTDPPLKTIIKISKDVFTTWRYFYETPQAGVPTTRQFHFYYLGVIADVLDEQAEKTMGGRVRMGPA